MRFTILGATGGTGRHLVAQALDAGHDVTAVVRDPAALGADADRADVRKLDVRDPEALAEAVAGADAVLSALGVRPPVKGPVTLLTDATRSALAAMAATGVRRLVTVSAAGAYTEPADGPVTRWAVKPLLQRLLRYSFADTRDADARIERSDTDWTIVRPPRLTDKPRTGTYRTGGPEEMKRAMTIARADVADCVLRVVGDEGTYRRVVLVAN